MIFDIFGRLGNRATLGPYLHSLIFGQLKTLIQKDFSHIVFELSRCSFSINASSLHACQRHLYSPQSLDAVFPIFFFFPIFFWKFTDQGSYNRLTSSLKWQSYLYSLALLLKQNPNKKSKFKKYLTKNCSLVNQSRYG